MEANIWKKSGTKFRYLISFWIFNGLDLRLLLKVQKWTFVFPYLNLCQVHIWTNLPTASKKKRKNKAFTLKISQPIKDRVILLKVMQWQEDTTHRVVGSNLCFRQSIYFSWNMSFTVLIQSCCWGLFNFPWNPIPLTLLFIKRYSMNSSPK